MELDRYRTLLLDRTYRPILALPWRRAMLLLLSQRVEVLEFYPRQVHTATRAWPLPAVMRAPLRADPLPRRVALTRRNVLLRDGHTCAYCGYRGRDALPPPSPGAGPSQKLTLDHVVPRSRGGGSTWENIVTACAACNRLKSDRTPDEARMPLRVRPCAPTALQLGRRGMLVVGNPPEEWRPWLAQ